MDSHIAGALTFCSEIGDAVAHEFRQLRIPKSYLLQPDGSRLRRERTEPVTGIHRTVLPSQHRRESRTSGLGDEHFLGLAGPLLVAERDQGLGYVLLSSYEPSLKALRATAAGVVGRGFVGRRAEHGCGVGCRRTHDAGRSASFRDGAEAIRRGIFSRRLRFVRKTSCGELAITFNHMTENLKTSRGGTREVR